MPLKSSTGLRNYMLDAGSLKAALADGLIKIYAGTIPATADAALGAATLLCTISDDATGVGIEFEVNAVDGAIAKKASEVWKGMNVASGTATFFRHVAPGDDGTASTTQKRLQGIVGVSGADLNLSSTILAEGAPQLITFYNASLPTF